MSACGSITSFPDAKGPIFLSNEKSINGISSDEPLKVISFNIRKSENICSAIDELARDKRFRDPDILLLQEMDEDGVMTIAKALQLNYLYYPIAKNKDRKTNFGNAILTKEQILQPCKLILPHKKSNGRIRNATNCMIWLGDKKLYIYSIHAETIVMGRKKRMVQIDSIISDIKSKTNPNDIVIVGGDFNTLLGKDLELIASKFKSIHLNLAIKTGAGTSRYLYNLLEPANDHIFYRNLNLIDSGVLTESRVSDHMPIYSQFRI